ncbi:TPA: hypothetical protein ACH3X1_012907 [Trebouxia sp. C0004]
MTCANGLTMPQTVETPDVRQCGLKLEALADTAGTLSTKLTQVTNIYNGLKYLQTLQWDAAHTTTSTPSSTTPTMKALYNDLLLLQSDASELYYHRLPFLITDLTGQFTGYTSVQPCMDMLLYQIEHINETVIALPPAVEVSYMLLSDLDVAFEAVMTGADTNPQTLATALNAYRNTLSTASPSFAPVNTTISSLNTVIGDLAPSGVTQPDFTTLVNDVNILVTATGDTSSANSAYNSVANAWQAYETYHRSQQGSDYTAFYNYAKAAAGVTPTGQGLTSVQSDLNTLINSDGTYTSQATALANDIIGVQPILPTPATLQTIVTDMTTAEAALPARGPYILAEATEGIAYAQLPSPKGNVLNSITAVVADLDRRISMTTTNVRADIASYNAQILDKIVALHNETVDKVTAKEDQYLPEVRHYDSYRMTAEYVYFSVVIFIALMLILIVIINFQWAASFFTFLLLLAMLIYGIIGTVFLLLAMVGHDECSNAETQIFSLLDKLNIGSTSFNATTLASYYILGEGGSLNAVADSATGVNFVSIGDTINNTIQETITAASKLPKYSQLAALPMLKQLQSALVLAVQGITGSYTLRYKLQDEVDDIQELGQVLFADVDAVRGLVQFQNVHPIYLGAKQLACCDVVDLVGNLWLSMFMATWFSVVLAGAMFCYIRRLDELPRKRCCGCAFRSSKEFLDPEDKRLAAIKNKGKYMPAGREGSASGTLGALSVNAIKVGASGSLAGGLITGVSNLSATSTASARLLKAGLSEVNSDGTPRASMTPRASSYMVPPDSPRVERSTDSQNRQSLLGVQSKSVEASGGSLLSPGSPGSNKKGTARKSFTTKSEQKKAELKNMMRMNQLE